MEVSLVSFTKIKFPWAKIVFPLMENENSVCKNCISVNRKCPLNVKWICAYTNLIFLHGHYVLLTTVQDSYKKIVLKIVFPLTKILFLFTVSNYEKEQKSYSFYLICGSKRIHFINGFRKVILIFNRSRL